MPCAGDRHVGGPGLGVLLDQALVTLGVHLQDVVAGAQRMQLRPAVEVLERIVGPVVGAPAHEALQVAAVVEVFLEELAAGRHVVGQQLPLEDRPARRIHGRVDANRRAGNFANVRAAARNAMAPANSTTTAIAIGPALMERSCLRGLCSRHWSANIRGRRVCISRRTSAARRGSIGASSRGLSASARRAARRRDRRCGCGRRRTRSPAVTMPARFSGSARADR